MTLILFQDEKGEKKCSTSAINYWNIQTHISI